MRQLASQAVWKETLGKADTVIVPLNARGDTVPFYCLHSLSGKVTDYIQLAALLGPSQPFFGLQVPVKNRDCDFGGAIPSVTVETIAEYYADSLERFQPAGPLALGGWSFGAILALEMAQQLKSRGRTVTLLVVFDIAPVALLARAGARSFAYFAELAWRLPGWIMRHDLVRKPSLSGLGAALRKKFLGAKGGGDAASAFAAKDFIHVAKYPPAHVSLMQQMLDAEAGYRPGAYDGAVQIYAASRQVSFRHYLDIKRAWQMIAPNAKIASVRGTHRSMIEKADGRRLASRLLRCLSASAK